MWFKKYRSFILGLIVLHLAFFAFALLKGNISGHVDSEWYIQIAHNLVENGKFYNGDLNQSIEPEFYTIRTPAYPVFIVLSSFFSNNLYLVIFFQAILSIISYWCVSDILKKTGVKINYYLWLLLSIVFFANQLILCNMVMTEILFQFFLVVAFWFFVNYLQSEKTKNIFWMNIAFALAVLARPILLYFSFPMIVLSAWLAWKKKNMKIFLFSFILPAVVALWCFRNYEQTGFYHYSYIKYFNLPDYNVSMLLSKEYGKDYADSTIKVMHQQAGQFTTIEEKGNYLEKESMRLIKEHKLSYLLLNIKGSLIVFIDPGRIDWFAFFRIGSDPFADSIWLQYKKDGFTGVFNAFKNFPVALLLTFIVIMIWNLALLIALIYYVFVWWGDYRARIFILVLLGYLTLITGPYGTARFKVSYYPLLVYVFIAVADHIYQKRKNQKKPA